MARDRMELSQILHEITDHCYYAKDSNLEMKYPAIRYDYSGDVDQYADNMKYLGFRKYSLIFITQDVDDPLLEKIRALEYCEPNRSPYMKDGLCHYPFTLYF